MASLKCIQRYLKWTCLLNSIMLTAQLTYKIDDTRLGRLFEGIGGLSGGGATSKLLMNYPEPYRGQILDYLFKPNFGASLHILKVEIGGDSQSTDGTEASHMHTEDDERNPAILLYGLAWAFPGWLAGATVPGTRASPYVHPERTADYIVRWVLGAKREHALDIDYIGIWNEQEYDTGYVKLLRSCLDRAGLAQVRIVVGDGDWSPADHFETDPVFANATYAIGPMCVCSAHYPGTLSSTPAQLSGKPLWSSEDYSTNNDDVGAGCWARILNQNYVRGLMTSTISWNLVAAYYDALPFARCALMNAEWPWAGSYEVAGPVWVTAHTTQFATPGWHYLQHAAGVDLLAYGGSFVALRSPDRTQLTLVIETMSHDHSLCIRPDLPKYTVTAQQANFTLLGQLVGIKKLHAWVTRLRFGEGGQSSFFQQLPDIEVKDSTFTLSLGVDELWTLSTVSTANKGSYPPSPPPFPFPTFYTDDFDAELTWSEPPNLTPQVGSFEVLIEPAGVVPLAAASGAHQASGALLFQPRAEQPQPPSPPGSAPNQVLVQTVWQQPIDWCGRVNYRPIALIGNASWSELQVQVDVAVPKAYVPSPGRASAPPASGVILALRVDRGSCDQLTARGLFLFTDFENSTVALTTDLLGAEVASSTSLGLKYDTWYRLTLRSETNRVVAFVNNAQVFDVTLPSHSPSSGFVGVGTKNFGAAFFDNLLISPL